MDPGPTSPPRPVPSLPLAALLLVPLAVALLWPALASGDRLGGKDWNAFLGQAQAEAQTLLEWGQFPAWNPWRRGGQVSFAQPESMLLTPVTPLVLWLGAPLAFKTLLVPLFVACGLGLVALSRDLGLRGGAALLPGALFVAASPLSLWVNGGLPNWLAGLAILPWLLLAGRRAASSRAWLCAGALLFALILFAGSVHHFVFFPLVLAIEAAARALRERSVRPLLASAAMGICGVALSLVRLVPLLELFSEFPRRLDASGRFMPVDLMLRSLLLPHPPEAAERLHVSVQGGSVLYWVDCGAFVGPLALLLAAAGLFAAWRRAWPFAALALAFAWLAAGSSVQPSLWDALHRLPVYASMQAPERFMGYVAFAIALLAGFGAERVAAFTGRRRWVEVLLLVVAVAPLAWFDAPIAKGAFPVDPPQDVAPATLATRAQARAAARDDFHQARYPDIATQWGGPLYEAVLRNAGNVLGQSDVPSLAATKARGDLDYRGEAWLAGRHGRVAARFSPNVIEVDAQLDAGDVLVINQNFFPGWREAASGRACEPRDGLIALPLAAGVHALRLEYAPRSLAAGVWLGAGALLAWIAWRVALRRARGRGAQRRAFGSELADRWMVVAHALLVAGTFTWYATRAPGGAVPPPVPWRETALAVAPQDGPDALQAALNRAAPGAVVRLAPGEYGAATIRRGVTLVADPPGTALASGVSIEDVPAGERVVVLGVRVGGAGLAIARCAGSVRLQGVGGTAGVVSGSGESPRVTIVESAEVVAFDAVWGATRVVGSTLHAARVEWGTPAKGGEPRAPSLELERSRVVINGGSAGRVELRDGSTLRAFELEMGAGAGAAAGLVVDADSTSSFADLTGRGFLLRLTQAYGDGRAARLMLRGPPRARGTLVVARDVELVALKGKNLGQLRACRFDGREILFPFELDAGGAQTIPVVPAGDDTRPGDGWFFQAFLEDASEGAGLIHTAMDGGLVEPR